MQGATLDLTSIIVKDDIATELISLYTDWETRRANWIAEKAEIQRYVWATDTKKTSNRSLPWKNSTTLPKLCQIRDNLYANYMAALFPKRKWLIWEADNNKDQSKAKAEVIEAYISNVTDRPEFKAEISKLVLDYIDYGNVIAGAEWMDQRVFNEESNVEKIGYVGPMVKRISPLDITFNPVARSFYSTGKFTRALYTLGDFASIVEKESLSDDRIEAEKLLAYMGDLRIAVGQFTGSFNTKNEILEVSGFGSFVDYLRSNYVEVITFYGDYYDTNAKKLHKNKVITIVDRHKVVHIKDNPSLLGGDGMYHCGWRTRQDSLWAMGPLDNLVGMNIALTI